MLSGATEPTRPSDIGEIVRLNPLSAGNYLGHTEESGLVERPDKKKSFYLITEKGRGYMEDPPEEIETEELEGMTEEKHVREACKGSTEDMKEDVAVPSQADLFRGIGEKLEIARKKGEVNLNTIIYFVQETADLDNLLSVWQTPGSYGHISLSQIKES